MRERSELLSDEALTDERIDEARRALKASRAAYRAARRRDEEARAAYQGALRRREELERTDHPLRARISALRSSLEITERTAQNLGLAHKEPQRSSLAAMRSEISRLERELVSAVPGLAEVLATLGDKRLDAEKRQRLARETRGDLAELLWIATQALSETRAQAQECASEAAAKQADPLHLARSDLIVACGTERLARLGERYARTNSVGSTRSPDILSGGRGPVERHRRHSTEATGEPVDFAASVSSALRAESSVEEPRVRQVSRRPAKGIEWRTSETLAAYLSRMGCTIVDLRVKGGCLWIVSTEARIRKVQSQLSVRGVLLHHAPKGGTATNGRQAWWTKSGK